MQKDKEKKKRAQATHILITISFDSNDFQFSGGVKNNDVIKHVLW